MEAGFKKIKISGNGRMLPPPVKKDSKVGDRVSYQGQVGEVKEWQDGLAVIKLEDGGVALVTPKS